MKLKSILLLICLVLRATIAIAADNLNAFSQSSIISSLDQNDMAYHQHAVEKAFSAPLNKTIRWHNPESGNKGSVVIEREGHQAGSGELCRQAKHTVVVRNQSQIAYNTACQNSNGAWIVALSDQQSNSYETQRDVSEENKAKDACAITGAYSAYGDNHISYSECMERYYYRKSHPGLPMPRQGKITCRTKPDLFGGSATNCSER